MNSGNCQMRNGHLFAIKQGVSEPQAPPSFARPPQSLLHSSSYAWWLRPPSIHLHAEPGQSFQVLNPASCPLLVSTPASWQRAAMLWLMSLAFQAALENREETCSTLVKVSTVEQTSMGLEVPRMNATFFCPLPLRNLPFPGS